jgi:hypothetical protein
MTRESCPAGVFVRFRAPLQLKLCVARLLRPLTCSAFAKTDGDLMCSGSRIVERVLRRNEGPTIEAEARQLGDLLDVHTATRKDSGHSTI